MAILVENTGRINFGGAMETERKGLLQVDFFTCIRL